MWKFALLLLLALAHAQSSDAAVTDEHGKEHDEMTVVVATAHADGVSISQHTAVACGSKPDHVEINGACYPKLNCDTQAYCTTCDTETQDCVSCVQDENQNCLNKETAPQIAARDCTADDGSAGKQLPGGSCMSLSTLSHSTENAVGGTAVISSSGEFDVSVLKGACAPFNAMDPTGALTCNQHVSMVTGTVLNWAALQDMRCYVEKTGAETILWSMDQPSGVCDCKFPNVMGTDAACHELTCEASSSGPGCRTCANPLTKVNDCATCNDGYILHDGDCLENTCTENPDDWDWQGCQKCRPQESRRHPQDCQACAHGYHFLFEQRNLPNQTDHTVYSTGTLVVPFEETGYCFPYSCVAGGNLENASPDPSVDSIIYNPNQRTIKLTPVVSTEAGNLDPSVPALSEDTLAFRDHCKTCVPQQKREKDDHCETCNLGYYLDEMHHTCRKKTCGVPHFRRNAVSCTAENLVPKPWSTPCVTCLDNSVGDDDACCVLVPPVMTCGAQGVFCAPGTHRDNYDSLECGDCEHYSDACCEPLTCDNQQVACRKDQNRVVNGDTVVCTNCLNGGEECCTDKPRTCGNSNVKCGHRQEHMPAETLCQDCLNDGLECCTPITKTCQNMGVFCHPNTHKFAENGLAVVCTDCLNYSSDCCEQTTCLNQRVPCMPGRVHKGDVACTDCLANTLECCEPLPPVQDTCGNQLVKCRHNLYRPAATECESSLGTCDDYGETCCVQPTCGNQGVGCSSLQARLDSETPCTRCADGGDECCTADRTCGLMGVKCALGGYRSPDTPCDLCDHFDTTECCHTVAKTCSNQGVVCLSGTHRPIDTECDDCVHYGGECCVPTTCGNQNVGCSRGRPRLGDHIECDSCHDNSDDCCGPLIRTCAAMGVKCMNGYYNPDQAELDCGELCINYAEPCCTEFERTCGNQNVVCSDNQSYLVPDTLCNDCVNHGSECCEDVTKTCANQSVVCRPGHQVDNYSQTICEAEMCLNDSEPCCKPYVKTCGSENVVCSAEQVYMLPGTECTTCENNGSDCCVDIPKTCDNQKVVCRPGHYAGDYVGKPCVGCKNDDESECCVPFLTTCGNQNVKCNDHQIPKQPQTICNGDAECSNDSSTCCHDVTDTCGNQAVLCRPGHFAANYKDLPCAEDGCKPDSQPCCVDFIETCGNQNVKCSPNQKYRAHDTPCNGECENYHGTCCEDVTHTCGNQGVICRPGYYVEGYRTKACEAEGCVHHADPCCSLYETTCGNQNVKCAAGQTYKMPSTVCTNCANRATGEGACCVDVQKTCDNQNVVCRPGHYASDYKGKSCVGCLNDDESECCTHFQTTCGNQNVKCSKHHLPVNANTACELSTGGCDNNSATCCVPVTATCANQNVVCRPGHYADTYATEPCATPGCLNDQQPCCKDFVKTCQNQNVQCTAGLIKYREGAETPCTTCDNYNTNECCVAIDKTCGSHGQECRQDLYKPSNTVCTTCDVKECCEEIPFTPTCANQLHVCDSDSLGKIGFYKPGDTPCPGIGLCTDELCCHSFPVTCGNQNVKCHPGTARHVDTTCTSCNNYASECCETVTCATAGVTCDTRYVTKVANFEEASCANAVGKCVLENDSAPCCEPVVLQAQAPTCLNKYGIDDQDLIDWPFLIHFKAMQQVTCDQSKGFYPRLDGDGNMEDNLCGVNGDLGKMSSCQQNDPNCCWRKTCSGNDDNANGFRNEGEGPFGAYVFGEIDCGDPTKFVLKENPQYIVCNGDCHDDCCEPVPAPETCLSARVACSYGYRRTAEYQTTECGDNCIENSVTCCERTSCNGENVQCNDLQEERVGALCFDCFDEGDECCKLLPVQDTCSNQRVACGFGFYKQAEYEKTDCNDCYDDGDECCVRKTCGSNGVNTMVMCGDDFNYKDPMTECYTCVNDGAECCEPVIPAKTCANQEVNCGFGYMHIDNLRSECVDCLDDGEECCVQHTCGNMGATCSAEGLKSRSDDTLCTLCMSDSDECCTKEETCWTSGIVCPLNKYHKHPTLICGAGCSEETCCAVKTCENQGVCCNANLGFSQVSNFNDQHCSSCADNCEECCQFDAPTCGSAAVGCGFGYHRKNGVENTVCNTCALNDAVCCEPRTCGADGDIDVAYVCPEGFLALAPETKCHFCEKEECCKPVKPPTTCKSENINCGVGMTRKPNSDNDNCISCVQNDSACCEPLICSQRVTCNTGYTNKGEVLCVGCVHDECCDVDPTCDSENVGCGFGMKPVGDGSQACDTCALNDAQCCTQKTCGSEGYVCPGGFLEVEDQEKKCAFCELSECCVPIIPDKTCESEQVGCGLGFHELEGVKENVCSTCALNDPICCGNNVCPQCPDGFSPKPTVHTCGLCTTEECCDMIPDPDTCENQQVGCGFSMKQRDIDRSVVQCTTCAHNDPMCCEAKTCGVDGPNCSSHFEQNMPFTAKGAGLHCSDCDLAQCCVPPVIQKTCVNQRVPCSGHFDNKAGYASATCENCLPNGGECCLQRTCANQSVDCNRDLFAPVTDYSSRKCLECADNTLECCEPKLCGHHFLDSGATCDPELYTTNARNTPCVNCGVDECCTVLPTLKCAEIIIPNGQAFYSRPAGMGSERTRGSVLTVECDLGYKFQTAEYTPSTNLNTRDQDLSVVDFPVCNPMLIEELIEGHVEVFSPTTSGWNRAPPVCRPVTCPLLSVSSNLTPDAVDKYDIGKVVYRDAQMDELPKRGAGYGPRDYAGEADVVCNEGWIRVPNICDEETPQGGDMYTTNTLEYALKGFWRLEGNTLDSSPHCIDSRTASNVGTCNDGDFTGHENYVEGAVIRGTPSQGLIFDGDNDFVEVHDTDNPNSGPLPWLRDNELNIDGKAWTASLWVKRDSNSKENDAYMFARYTEDYQPVVAIYIDDGWIAATYNRKYPLHVQGDPDKDKLGHDRWISLIVRMDGEKLQIWVDGVMKASRYEDDTIADTTNGHVYIGADREPSGAIANHFDGQLDEVRYYTRGLTDEEIACIAAGKMTCSAAKYYAKPYNTQGCNRESEEIQSADECREAITQLLQDSVLGNSLNGGERFGLTIRDEQKESSYDDVPAKCSYREEDAQIVFNPAATGRAHTSLAPICRTNPTGSDLSTIGCLPKCLNNGMWSVELPTCEKDWCHPIFEEWSCCANRYAEKNQAYWLKYHDQNTPTCPIGYGDCDDDEDCVREDGVYGLCSQQRDLDNIDVCITDLDPCGGVKGATGTMCVVMTAVGMDYRASAANGHNTLFYGGLILALGSFAGYYMLRSKKGEEHRALLEEEL